MTPSSELSRNLTLGAAVGAGVSGGVLFAFSTFVMTALGRLPDRRGLAAMQAVNKAAPNPLFMATLFGTAIASLVVAVPAVRHLDERTARYQVVGCGLYLAGIALTVGYHVPRNDALALLDPSSPASAAPWRSYLSSWTQWNHVRTLTSITAAVLFTLAYRSA